MLLRKKRQGRLRPCFHPFPNNPCGPHGNLRLGRVVIRALHINVWLQQARDALALVRFDSRRTIVV